MKQGKFIFRTAMLSCVVLSLSYSLWAQKKEEQKAATTTLIESRRYEFVAQSVSPQGGRLRQLTTYYNLVVTPDSIIADLPYIGRSYTAPVNSADIGINFTSTQFDYDVKNRKKGGWDISIKPKDKSDVQQLTLTVYESGSSYLQIISTNRQLISYNGNVQPIKEKK